MTARSTVSGICSTLRVRLNAEHAGALVAHRINGAAEGTADQAPKNGTSHAAGTIAGADDGDAVGRENRVQRMAFGAQDIVCLVLRGDGASAFCRTLSGEPAMRA